MEKSIRLLHLAIEDEMRREAPNLMARPPYPDLTKTKLTPIPGIISEAVHINYATEPLNDLDTRASSTASTTASYKVRLNQELFISWCAVRIQAWWRGMLFRKRFQRLRRAAKVIQAAWRAYLTIPRAKRKEYKVRRAAVISPPPVYLALTKNFYQVPPVVKIQRCWRAYMDKFTFEEIRNVIHSYEKEDPRAILLQINRSEATLVDKASGLHVRFRLNGLSFPPVIVYKVYTHRPVVDMGSFSPRQYSGATKNCAKTYIRCENNGWRPVIGTPAQQTGPRVVLEVPNLGGFFSNSPEERRILKLLALKKRKRAWLRKLYTEGRAAEYSKASANQSGEEATRKLKAELPDLEPDFELMQWSAGLDFDVYERNWYTRAISLFEVYDKDWQKLGTCLPAYDVPAHTMPVFDTPSVFY